MKLMLFSMLLTLSIGYALGGRLRNLSQIRIRWMPLAIIGFALQWVTGPGDTVPLLSLYVSFVLLTVFAFRNIRVAGFSLILIGIAMNFMVIGLNLGMPVSRQALVSSGQSELLGDLINNAHWHAATIRIINHPIARPTQWIEHKELFVCTHFLDALSHSCNRVGLQLVNIGTQITS